jgi:hypothetical protein
MASLLGDKERKRLLMTKDKPYRILYKISTSGADIAEAWVFMLGQDLNPLDFATAEEALETARHDLRDEIFGFEIVKLVDFTAAP